MPSKDRSQQRLRDRKRQWNTVYRDVSQKLKAFKDGLNGKGNQKLGLPPSKIQDPLPSQIGSFLGQLSSDFQKLVSDADAIIAEQGGYSQTRKKKQPKSKVVIPAGGAIVPPTVPPTDVVNTLARIGSIDKNASSRLSRSWQYLTSMFSKQQLTKHRIGLLSKAADLYYNLLDLENDVLSLSVHSIAKAVSRYETVKYNFYIIQQASDMLKEYLETNKTKEKPNARNTEINQRQQKQEQPSLQQQAPQPSGPPIPRIQYNPNASLDDIIQNVNTFFKYMFPPKRLEHIKDVIKQYHETNDQATKELYEHLIKEDYRRLLKAKKALLINSEIIKLARDPITRFLKRQLVRMAPFNRTASVRLEIAEWIDKLKIELRALMNSLEKDANMNEIANAMDKMDSLLQKIVRPMHMLGVYYKEDFISRERARSHKMPSKHTDPNYDPFTDILLRRRVRRDLGRDVF
jgi:hypothetical protein